MIFPGLNFVLSASCRIQGPLALPDPLCDNYASRRTKSLDEVLLFLCLHWRSPEEGPYAIRSAPVFWALPPGGAAGPAVAGHPGGGGAAQGAGSTVDAGVPDRAGGTQRGAAGERLGRNGGE